MKYFFLALQVYWSRYLDYKKESGEAVNLGELSITSTQTFDLAMKIVIQNPMKQRVNDWIRTRISKMISNPSLYHVLTKFLEKNKFPEFFDLRRHYSIIEYKVSKKPAYHSGISYQLWNKYFHHIRLHKLTVEILKFELAVLESCFAQNKCYSFTDYTKDENSFPELMNFESYC